MATPTLSDSERESIIKAAISAKAFTYSPYSKFPVGAAFLSTSGKMITGCNVENASFGGTICAERTAIVKAVSEGIKEFKALAVTTDIPECVSPCGICRQVIREFCQPEMPILLVPGNYEEDGNTEIKVMTLEQLLPMSFGPEHLPKY